MVRRRPDLIVPIRDRRQHRRLLTFRNIRNAVLVIVAIFAVITIRSEMRDTTSGEFGRLYGDEVGKPAEVKRVEVVAEAPPAPVPDQIAADPMLTAPAAREQWLHDQPQTTAAVMTPLAPVAPVTQAPVQGDSRVAIVGGPEGVSVVQESRHAPLLRGGFGH
ncbi:MAG TPA: hypothetical protein VFN10_13960 [Thermoanaerobaculia bacterium]|nr:hypothetical protein [Thermoanaerobaculia bacterium]